MSPNTACSKYPLSFHQFAIIWDAFISDIFHQVLVSLATRTSIPLAHVLLQTSSTSSPFTSLSSPIHRPELSPVPSGTQPMPSTPVAQCLTHILYQQSNTKLIYAPNIGLCALYLLFTYLHPRRYVPSSL